MNFMAYSAVLGHLLIEKKNTNLKKLSIGKLSQCVLTAYAKFGHAHLNNEQKLSLHGIFGFNLYDVIS